MKKIEKKVIIKLAQLKKMAHFKATLFFLLITIFSCNNKQEEVEIILSNQYDEMNSLYKNEASNIYLAVKRKTEDFPYLKGSFDSIEKVKKELDVFFITYPNLKKKDKLKLIFKTRKKIDSLTNFNIKFVDESLLIKVNDDILDKGINVDFSKVYYNILSEYYSKHCNVSH